MKGRTIVIVFLAAGLAAAGGALWYRKVARSVSVKELDEPGRRDPAFLRLLRANGLLGLAKEYAWDKRAGSPGADYLLARGKEGKTWRLVRGVRVNEDRSADRAIFIFDEAGTAAHVVENGTMVTVFDAEGPVTAAIIAPRPDSGGAVSSVLIVGQVLEEGLRVRGGFALRNDHGSTEPSNAGGLPVFRFDWRSKTFRGPPGGPDQPWEVLRAHSPAFAPE